MLEMIMRMRAILDGIAPDSDPARNVAFRGMHDLLLAMEERVETMRIAQSHGIIHRDLWERAS